MGRHHNVAHGEGTHGENLDEIPFTQELEDEWDALKVIFNSLIEQKNRLKAELGVVAKQKRDAGTVINGLSVATDADGRSLLIGAKQGGKVSRKIVTKTGRDILNKAEVEALAEGVDDYIQSVFDRQYDLEELIDAAVDQVDMDAIDINLGWPT